MRGTAIGEVTEDVATWNPQVVGSSAPIRYVDISSVDATTKSIREPVLIAAAEAPSRARQLIQVGDVIVSTVRPRLNAVAFVPAELDGATASTGFCVLRPDSTKVDSRFLFHWVRTSVFVRHLESRATGASYPAVTDRVILESIMPLPPLVEQRRIAALLDRADAVRRKREESRQLVDELLRSVFLEMFGDPVRNERGWEVRPLADLAAVERGRFTPRPRNDSRFYGGEFPFIQTGDIARSSGKIRDWTQTLNGEGAAVSRMFSAGTIAVAIAANIGDAALVEFSFCCPDSVVGVAPLQDMIETEFLLEILRHYKPSLKALAPQTAQANINLGVLRPLMIPVPPIAKQRHYGAIARRLSTLSGQVTESSSELGLLQETVGGAVWLHDRAPEHEHKV